MKNKIKVVVFDDNKVRRNGLEMMIDSSENMVCLATFNDCRDVVNLIGMHQPDVVLMDIDMPNVNGMEGLTLIKQHFPEIKILMQTVFEDDDKIFAAICSGADGYILKKTPPHELLKAIVDVIEGGAPMTPTVARQVIRMVNHQDKKASVVLENFDLTNVNPKYFLCLPRDIVIKWLLNNAIFHMQQ
ncbi:MAG: response regulator transcription factor [Bacteroidia bacterium]